MTKRDDAHLLSGAYALDAVTPEEAELVQSAMEHSEELRSEVVGLTDTAVALGLGLPPVAPRPQLRASILDAIQTLPQLPAPAQEAEAPHEEPAIVQTAMPAGAHVVPARRRRRRRPMALLAAAATAVLLFGGGFLVQRTLLEPQSEYTAVVAAADVQSARATVPGGGVVKVSWSKSEHRTAVSVSGVKAPSGKVLQLWSVRGGTATSAGLYEDGDRFALITGTPSSGERLAVTVEPDGGSTQPTSEPIAAVPLDA
ncbi:anti-sigma factor [Amnibacterium soli]|uniref:Regulator of SigK n=1 Tax=Amnibacterium soli TaxID=1282736 RepID=A0ABP8ZAG9_9MICO